MDDHKILPWDDYGYIAKLPDFWEVSGLMCGTFAAKAYSVSPNRSPNRKTSIAMMLSLMFGGYLLGKGAVLLRNNYFGRRQLFLDNYMDKHPNDFLSPEPKKFKDVLYEWKPHR